MRISIFIYFTIAIVFSSCYSNAIYFDIENRSIKSCNSKEINHIYINNDTSDEMYSIVWVDTILMAPKTIELKNIQTGYKIYAGWNNKQILSRDLKLSALAVYTIERVQGDASGYKIKVWTDKQGNIIKTSHSNCSY